MSAFGRDDRTPREAGITVRYGVMGEDRGLNRWPTPMPSGPTPGARWRWRVRATQGPLSRE
jgi:hypothetical protein